MKKFIEWCKSSKSDFALFVIFLVLINLVSIKFYKRIDLTESKSYSLSKESKNLVKNIQQPLSVYAFFDGSLPAAYSQVAQYVDDLLTEYEGAAKKNFNVYRMNTSDSQKEKLASDFGLLPIQIQEVKNKEVGFKQGYMGIVVTYGDAVELINPVVSTDGFEYELTSTISKIISRTDTLAGLSQNDHIELKLYFSDTFKSTGIIGIDEIEKLTRSAYKSVNKHALGRIDFMVENSVNDSVLADAEKYGLMNVSLVDRDGSEKSAVLGIVLTYNDKFYTLPDISIQKTIFGWTLTGIDDLETSVSDGLKSLLSNITQIGYVTGHGELPLEVQKQTQYGVQNVPANFVNVVSDKYEFVELNLEEENIPAGMNCLVINGPTEDFSEEELYKIDQFIMRGGNVAFYVSSFLEDQMAMYYGGDPYYKNEGNILQLIESYGIKIDPNIVFEKNCAEERSQQNGLIKYYWVPYLQKNELSQKNPITKNLGYVLMVQCGSVDASAAIENKDVNVTVLAKTSDESWTQEENIFLDARFVSAPKDKEQFHSSVLSVLAEGKFTSHFTAEPESSDDLEESSQAEDSTIKASNHLSKSIATGKIIVAGTSNITNMIDDAGSTPTSMFFMNMIDYLNGHEDLCTMRTKSLSANVLTIKSNGAAKFWKYFCEYGILVIIVVIWFIVWKLRSNRRKQINKKYNPNDDRVIK